MVEGSILKSGSLYGELLIEFVSGQHVVLLYVSWVLIRAWVAIKNMVIACIWNLAQTPRRERWDTGREP